MKTSEEVLAEIAARLRRSWSRVVASEWTRHRRIEEERIPLDDAATVVHAG